MDLNRGTYTAYARVAPMYITLLPLAVAFGVWFPDASVINRLGLITIIPALLGILLGEIGRDRGRKKQDVLWKQWGGPLLSQYLRHDNPRVNQHLKEKYHSNLTVLLPGLQLPSAAEEASNPEAADDAYGASAQHIVNIAREDPERYWTSFKENRSYGFRRNLWGLKPYGMWCSLCGLFSSIVWLLMNSHESISISGEWLTAVFICATILAMWLFLIRPEWVRVANDAYAMRVLESTDRMLEHYNSDAPRRSDKT